MLEPDSDTYRLNNIPKSYTPETVKELFSKEDQKLIFGPVSLATSVYATVPGTKVATVSFKNAPSFLRGQSGRDEDVPSANTNSSVAGEGKSQNVPKRQEFDYLLRDRIEVHDPEAHAIRIDNILEGLTPLSEPEVDDDIVE